MKKQERIELMWSKFGKTKGKICRNCSHVVRNEMSRAYNKCECFGLSRSEATDFPMLQTACGLFNKETDVADIYKTVNPKRVKPELQSETLF